MIYLAGPIPEPSVAVVAPNVPAGVARGTVGVQDRALLQSILEPELLPDVGSEMSSDIWVKRMVRIQGFVSFKLFPLLLPIFLFYLDL